MIGSKQGDPRVQALLDQLDLKYDVDSDGDYHVLFALDEGRSQLAIIRSETAHLGKFEIREITSPACTFPGPLDADTANALLIYNAHVKLGSWRLVRFGDDSCAAMFAAQIAANTDAQSLFTTLRVVIETADEVENKLTQEDNF